MKAVNNQLDMFGALLSGEDLPVPTHHIKVDKPLFITEFFAGYGSQSLALKYLGVEFKHNIISEWAVKSIQAYKDLHYSEDNTDYSQGKTIEEIRSFLYGRISRDYNNPLTNAQIDKMKESEARVIYSNMVCTHNLGSIVGIKAEDLALKKENYNLVTYSFPCQDLSNAGKMAGINENTRSGLLLQVERILRESVEKGLPLPDLLMMENVPGVHGTRTMEAWNSWLNFLNTIGYHNAWQDCNAKDYGIPQSRNRCFMFSWLDKEGYYEFPKKIPLKLRLKDMLEENVDEKYYLSNKTIDMFVKHTEKKQAEGCGFKFEPTDGGGYAKCIQTRAGQRTEDNYIKCEQVGQIEGTFESTGRVYSSNGLSPTINTCGGGQREPKIMEENNKTICLNSKVNGKQPSLTDRVYDSNGCSTAITTSLFFMGSIMEEPIKIKEATKKGYTEAEVGDSINLTYPESQTRRGRVGKGVAQTLDCNCEQGVVEPIAYDEQNKYLRTDGTVGTLTTDGSSPKHNNRVIEPLTTNGKDIASTIRATMHKNGERNIMENFLHGRGYEGVIYPNYCIRKLTPKEAFRLMGLRDEDYDKVAQNQSNSSLYHLAGDSIVCNGMLTALLGQLFEIQDKEIK